MEIVDKEQERIDYENSPEGRKKKRIEQIGSVAGGCKGSRAPRRH